MTTARYIPFLGKNHLVEITRSGQKTGITLAEDKITVNYFEHAINQPPITSVLASWYRQAAKRHIKKRVAMYSLFMEENYNHLAIKDQATRWGSCSSLRNLNFNWRLIMMPPSIIDYVIIHEIAHLKHLDHSAAFWRTVAVYDPDYAAHRHWLKENGERYFRLFPPKK